MFVLSKSVPDKLFRLGLMFVGNARSFTLAEAPAFLTNFSLSWKGLVGTNSPLYYELNYRLKKFYNIGLRSASGGSEAESGENLSPMVCTIIQSTYDDHHE
jgi:hypothetical protein